MRLSCDGISEHSKRRTHYFFASQQKKLEKYCSPFADFRRKFYDFRLRSLPRTWTTTGHGEFSWIVFSDSLDQQFSVRAECEFINFEFFSSSRFPYFKHSERPKQSATLQLAAIYWMSLRLRLDSLAGCSSMSVVNSILNAGSLFLNLSLVPAVWVCHAILS